MTSSAKYIPEGFHTATPYLMVKDLARAIAFYTQAFGAIKVTHLAEFKNAEIKIGESMIMIGDHQDISTLGPQSLPPVSVYLYVEDAEAVARQAIAAGARELYPVKDQPYGNREGGIEDPFGIVWWIATQMESARSK